MEVSQYGASKADYIAETINNIFKNQKSKFYMEKTDYPKKTISCTADGACENFGKYTGVLTQVKKHMSVKQAFVIPEFKKIDDAYKSSYYLFRNNSKLKES